jgi:hypothetical protein
MTPQAEVMTALYAVDINQLRSTSTEDLEKLVKWTWLLHQLASGELQSRDDHQNAMPEREPGKDS